MLAPQMDERRMSDSDSSDNVTSTKRTPSDSCSVSFWSSSHSDAPFNSSLSDSEGQADTSSSDPTVTQKDRSFSPRGRRASCFHKTAFDVSAKPVAVTSRNELDAPRGTMRRRAKLITGYCTLFTSLGVGFVHAPLNRDGHVRSRSLTSSRYQEAQTASRMALVMHRLGGWTLDASLVILTILTTVFRDTREPLPRIPMAMTRDSCATTQDHSTYLWHDFKYFNRLLHNLRDLVSTPNNIPNSTHTNLDSIISTVDGLVRYDVGSQPIQTTNCHYLEGLYRGTRTWIAIFDLKRNQDYVIDSLLYMNFMQYLGLSKIIVDNNGPVTTGIHAQGNGLQFHELTIANKAYHSDPCAPKWLIIPSVANENTDCIAVLDYGNMGKTMSLTQVVTVLHKAIKRHGLDPETLLPAMKVVWACVIDGIVWLILRARLMLRDINCQTCRIFIHDITSFLENANEATKARSFVRVLYLDWQHVRKLTQEEMFGMRTGLVSLENLNLSLLMRSLSMMGVELSRPIDILDIKSFKKKMYRRLNSTKRRPKDPKETTEDTPSSLLACIPTPDTLAGQAPPRRCINLFSGCELTQGKAKEVAEPSHASVKQGSGEDLMSSTPKGVGEDLRHRLHSTTRLINLILSRRDRLAFIEELAIKKIPRIIFSLIFLIARMMSMRVDIGLAITAVEPSINSDAQFTQSVNFEFILRQCLARMRFVQQQESPSIIRGPGGPRLKFSSPPNNAFEWKLHKLLRELPVLAVQVSLLHGDRQLVNIAGGRRGPFNNEQVTENTMFSIGNLSRLILQFVLLHQLSKETTDADAPRDKVLERNVMDYWPEFGCHGKEEVTIRQALSHTGGLHRCWPSKCTLSLVLNTDASLEHCIASSPIHIEHNNKINEVPDNDLGIRLERCSYCYWSDVTLLARVIENIANVPVADAMQDTLIEPLSLEQLLWYPYPEGYTSTTNTRAPLPKVQPLTRPKEKRHSINSRTNHSTHGSYTMARSDRQALPSDMANCFRGLVVSEGLFYGITNTVKIGQLVGSKKARSRFVKDHIQLAKDYERQALVVKDRAVLEKLKSIKSPQDTNENYAIADLILNNIHLFDGELSDVQWISKIPVPSLNMRACATGLTRILHAFLLNDQFDASGVQHGHIQEESASKPSDAIDPRFVNYRPFSQWDFFAQLREGPLTVDDDLMTNISLGGIRGLFTGSGFQAFPQYAISDFDDDAQGLTSNWGLGFSANCGAIAYSFVNRNKLTSLAINVNDHTTGPHVSRLLRELITKEFNVIQDDKWSSSIPVTPQYIIDTVKAVTTHRLVVNDHSLSYLQRELVAQNAGLIEPRKSPRNTRSQMLRPNF